MSSYAESLYSSISLTTCTVLLLWLLAACTDHARFAPLTPGTPVLAFGDSVTAGVGAAAGQHYPGRLAAATGWRVINVKSWSIERYMSHSE